MTRIAVLSRKSFYGCIKRFGNLVRNLKYDREFVQNSSFARSEETLVYQMGLKSRYRHEVAPVGPRK
jgi:hypothetical protein